MPVKVIDTKKNATKTFETFYDRKPAKEITLPFGWPKEMQEVGVGKAEMYRSNKWMKDLREFDDYKHVSEGMRTVYVEPGFLRQWGSAGRPIDMVGPMFTFEEPMPKHFTRLGQLIGLQMRLYELDEKGELRIPEGDEALCEVSIARAWLGSARHPKTDETFLFVFTNAGVHMLLTGDVLSIEKDGIAG